MRQPYDEDEYYFEDWDYPQFDKRKSAYNGEYSRSKYFDRDYPDNDDRNFYDDWGNDYD